MGLLSCDGPRSGDTLDARETGGMVWARLLLGAAKVASVGPLVVRWSTCKVDLLPARPPPWCYKCLERGHTIANCPCSKNRADKCYRCGEQRHVTKKCDPSVPNCPLCLDVGKRSDHILGSRNCTPRTIGG